eukprot:SAG11_NODE_23441_length_388_cov_1.235294_2_plen_62_part_01
MAVAIADHLMLDFVYDEFWGVPIGMQNITATVGGDFQAAAGFNINAGEITIDIGPEQVFSAN